MTWTTEKPDVSGWYWVKCRPYSAFVTIIEVVERDGKMMWNNPHARELSDLPGGECHWAGPIPKPT